MLIIVMSHVHRGIFPQYISVMTARSSVQGGMHGKKWGKKSLSMFDTTHRIEHGLSKDIGRFVSKVAAHNRCWKIQSDQRP